MNLNDIVRHHYAHQKRKDDDLRDYNALQFQHIEARYSKYLADTGKHISLTHYVVYVYVPSGLAKQFHEEYNKQH